MTFEDLDTRTGLPDYYTAKLLCAPLTARGRFHRRTHGDGLFAARTQGSLEDRANRLTAAATQLDRFAPRVALSEASAHGATLSFMEIARLCPMIRGSSTPLWPSNSSALICWTSTSSSNDWFGKLGAIERSAHRQIGHVTASSCYDVTS